MRFPHEVVIYATKYDDEQDIYVPDLTTGQTCKAFILPKATQDIQRFTGSGNRLATVGQLANQTFDVFLPLTAPKFSPFSQLWWAGNAFVDAGYFEISGEPKAYQNPGGKTRSVQTVMRRVI